MTTVSNFVQQKSAQSNLRSAAIADFDQILNKAQDLVKATAGAGEEQVEELRKGIERQLKLAKSQLSDLEENVKEGAHTANTYVHHNPWPFIGAAAGVGVLLGALAVRK
jgi:ElaB/YqjD/DUF883 family membrane-anchored ribosome-binding protein